MITDDGNDGDAGVSGSARSREDGTAEQAGGPSAHDRDMLVEELAGPDDYWLSITDAARVTRRQEITIRRWIAAGVLAVRGQRMGLNKRTRHVRASDLARLTPIIDPTAAITGTPAQVDLLSIPEQQARLQVEQQRVALQVAGLAQQAEAFDGWAAELREQVLQAQREAVTAAQALQGVQALTQQVITRVDVLTDALASHEQGQALHTRQISSLEHALDEMHESVATLDQRTTAAEHAAMSLNARIDDLATLAGLATRHEEQLVDMHQRLAELRTLATDLDKRMKQVLQGSERASEEARQRDAAIQAVQARLAETQAAAEQSARSADERIAALQQAQEQLHREVQRMQRAARVRGGSSRLRP